MPITYNFPWLMFNYNTDTINSMEMAESEENEAQGFLQQ